MAPFGGTSRSNNGSSRGFTSRWKRTFAYNARAASRTSGTAVSSARTTASRHSRASASGFANRSSRSASASPSRRRGCATAPSAISPALCHSFASIAASVALRASRPCCSIPFIEGELTLALAKNLQETPPRASMRYFLLDRVTDVVPGESARGIKNVTLTDEVLHDHFPDHPILPGALIVEGMAQLAGFLLEVSVNAEDTPIVRALLVQIQSAKFSHPAEPGDQIELVARIGSILDAAGQVDVEALVAGQRIARAQLTFMLKAIESDRVHEQRRYLYRLWT